MSDINGLAQILANVGTLHSIEEPPEREDWPTTEEYEAAYRDWYRRVHYWHATRTQ